MQELLSDFTGINLKNKREAALLTQEELATVIGVKKLTISQWENEKSKPSLRHLRALKTYLDKKQ